MHPHRNNPFFNIKRLQPRFRKPSWSIRICKSRSLYDMQQAEVLAQITREDIDDLPAGFVADPFMICQSGFWYLFMEVMDGSCAKGSIGLASSINGVNWTYQGIVLDEPYHLSYPFVFEHDGEMYMLPETLGAKKIQLYRAKGFPFEWEVCSIPLVGEFADPTLFYHKGLWWLFACKAPLTNDELGIYYSESLFGEFKPHLLNPIHSGNNRIARPAGRVLVYDNKILRFAQDCFPYYGTAVRAFEIEELTPSTYRERPIHIDPFLKGLGANHWNGRGMHHIDAHQLTTGEWIACVDGFEL